MAENGLFRSSMRGFNRQDVLNYIDSLQSENEQQVSGLQEQLSAVREQLSALQAQADALAQERDAAVNKAEMLSEQNDHLEALIDEHNRNNREMRARLEEVDRQEKGSSQLELDNARLRAVNSALREKQEHYQAVAGQLEDIAVQMRKYSLGFLSATSKRSEECLDAIEQTIALYESELAAVKGQISQARESLEEQKNAAGVHLDEMLSSLLGDTPLPAEEKSSAASAESPAKDPVSKPRLVPQRRPARRQGGWLANLLK